MIQFHNNEGEMISRTQSDKDDETKQENYMGNEEGKNKKRTCLKNWMVHVHTNKSELSLTNDRQAICGPSRIKK